MSLGFTKNEGGKRKFYFIGCHPYWLVLFLLFIPCAVIALLLPVEEEAPVGTNGTRSKSDVKAGASEPESKKSEANLIRSQKPLHAEKGLHGRVDSDRVGRA